MVVGNYRPKTIYQTRSHDYQLFTMPLTKQTLSPIPKLFKKTFVFFTQNAKKLLLITSLALIPIIILQLLIDFLINHSLLIDKQSILIGIALAILISSILIFILSIAHPIALIDFLNKKTLDIDSNIKANYYANKKYFFPYLYVSILLMILIKGAIIILLSISNAIKPLLLQVFSSKIILVIFFSIIFLIMLIVLCYIIIGFMFSFYVLICENIKGWQAIKRSINISKHYWLQILIRFAIFLILLSLIYELFRFLLANAPNVVFLVYSFLFAILIIPLTITYLYFIYLDLQE